MKLSHVVAVIAVTLGGCAGFPPADEPKPLTRGAPLFDNLGSHSWPISTNNALAQRYFDQGIVLAYGFNHAEAARSFREAARLDPQCAMCEWGIALALGPNINKAMDDSDVPAAYAASRRAVDKASWAGPAEQALIAALAARYVAEPVADRTPLDQAYADAMATAADDFPDELDLQTLYAEALLDLMPWDYYTEEGEPKPATLQVFETLEGVLAQAPDHPGAIHFYIHAVEASDTPERAEPYADTLRDLVPGAGHLVHMPSHIYLRVGRYADASRANELAAEADETYIAQCKAQGFYPATYYPHNLHFLWYTAAMEGRLSASTEAAERLYSNLPLEAVSEFVEVEYFVPIPWLGQARFGQWAELRRAEPPSSDLPYASAMFHYTQGLARLATNEPGARDALARLREIRDGEAIQTREIPFVMGASLASLAADELSGRIAWAEGDADAAIGFLRQAVAREDALPYVEPPYWYYPTRQLLGALLLDAGRPAEAEAVYRRDLELYPSNGWSLFGLSVALAAQGMEADAAEARQRFDSIWQTADIALSASVVR